MTYLCHGYLSSVALVQIVKETTLTIDQQLEPFNHIAKKLFCHQVSCLLYERSVIRMNLDLVSSYCCKEALWIARVYYCRAGFKMRESNNCELQIFLEFAYFRFANLFY